jgi:hypothetical protein
VGFPVDSVALGQIFSEYFGFPCLPIFIPQISPQSPSPITRGWYNRPVVAAVPKVPPHKLKKNNPLCPSFLVLQNIKESIRDFFFQKSKRVDKTV